ncbi:MAG TPA: response regulator, partial [Pirellulaceae bacterium]|nr:response regulator [Pirellulaceae bacterium]
IGEQQPDIVVTDLQMPEMDGLQLVTAIRIHFPRVPVVLITAHGSEELAVRALEQGAASYVPKSQLAANLQSVVDQVLELAKGNRGYEALAQSMDYAEFRFRADNDLATTDRLVELIQQLVGSIGVCDTGGQVRLGMALEEAFRLAVLRGNLEMTPEMLLAASGHGEEARTWLDKRRQSEPYASRRVLIHVKITPDEAHFTIGHEGPPLALADAGAAAENPALENPSDRSLILMRAFLDEVEFDPSGTSMKLVKRRSA